VTFTRQSAELPDIKELRPEYHDINAQVLQDVLHRLDKAFAAFFRRVKAGEQPGYPRFQGRNRYNSFTYPQVGEHGGAAIDGKFLHLAKIGCIRLRRHRPLLGVPKTVTIIREADGWYASVSCAEVPVQPFPLADRETGIDVGLKVFLITAEGEAVENPRHYRKAERELQKAQCRLARRKKGSKRRKKAARLVARKHQKVKRQRRDFHHKTALDLVRQYDTIYLEDLHVNKMSRRPAPKPDGNGGYLPNGASKKTGLNKSIQDAGWYSFRLILEGKAACAGRRVVVVPPAYTSQDCSGCGTRVEKSLSVRTHVCTSCGLILDRDENAARNIQWRGHRLQGLAAEAVGEN
jgi:putative transposase